MVSLMQLLREVQGNPKAIILAGAPGAGKGSILGDLDLRGLKIFNIDASFINLLKQSNISLDLKNHDADSRSKAAQAMAQATNQLKKEIIPTAISNKQSFILDGTASSYKQTSGLKFELEDAGYSVFMLYVYADLERSLQQNQDRFEKSGGQDRSLSPSIVLSTWVSVTKNYDEYKTLFGNNFVSVANTLKNQKVGDIESIINTYLTPFTPQNTKPKDEKAQAKSDASKQALNTEVSILLKDKAINNIITNSVSKEEAQSKLKSFLS